MRKPRSDQTGGAFKEKELELEHREISIGAADNQAAFFISATDLSDLLGRMDTHGDAFSDIINCATADNSGCDLRLAVSMFADVKAQRIEPNHLSLRQLQDRLTSTIAPDKAALPLVKLGTFGDARTGKGSLRHDSNLLSVSGVEGDYDAGAVSPRKLPTGCARRALQP